jgi:hypothetical protein
MQKKTTDSCMMPVNHRKTKGIEEQESITRKQVFVGNNLMLHV